MMQTVRICVGWSSKFPLLKLICIGSLLLAGGSPLVAELPRQTAQKFAAVRSQLSNQLLAFNVSVSQRAPSVMLFTHRGDLHLFLGKFPKAVSDYQEALNLDSQMPLTHRRLGTALYFEEKYPEAAEQFQQAFELDESNPEDRIWHYFSLAKAEGSEKARRKLLSESRIAEQPFAGLGDMILEKLTADQLLEKLAERKLEGDEFEKQQFYAKMYLGMNAAVQGNREEARQDLTDAVSSSWAEMNGLQPQFLWHIARVQLELLDKSGPSGK